MLRRRSPLRRILVLVSLVIVAALAVAGMVLWRRFHLPVFFDNALAVPVTITVDGTAFLLAADARVERSLAAGAHAITVTGPQGEIERYTAKIPTPLLLEAFEDPGFFVYNVSELRVYELAVLGYTAKMDEHRQTYEREVIGLQRFFGEGKVDFLFREAPPKIRGENLAEVERRTAFNTVPGGLVEYATFRIMREDPAGAEKALRRDIALEPCGYPAHESLTLLLFLQKRPEEALATARGWRDDCPGVDPHRLYQTALRYAGRTAEGLAEYKARLGAHPEVGANHYLYGRLLVDPARQLAEYRAAIRLDPGLARASVAIGSVFLLEQPAAALEALGHAVALPEHPTDFYLIYAMAAVGAGADALGPADRALQGAGGLAEDLWQARWLLALAGGRFDDAQDLLNAHEDAEPNDPDLWEHRILLLRLAGRREDLDRELSRASLREDLASGLATVRLDLALEEKRFLDAAAVLDQEMAAEAGPLDRLYAAAALLLAGDRKAADERLARLGGEIAKDDDPGQATRIAGLLLEVLRRPVPAEEAVRGVARIDFGAIPHAYFMLGVRATAAGDAKAAGAFFEKSSKAALGLEFPYLAARALAATR